LRSFIAIELPETIKKALAEFQQELEKCGADVRWARPENVHLTLKFLGNIEEDKADIIAEKIKGTCKGHSGFKIGILGTGVFPDKRSPRVLWAGIDLNDDIMTLQKGIEEVMASLGFERENRRFSPHLTLGRFRSSRGKQAVLDKMDSYRENIFGIMDVDSVLLMRSDLDPGGAKHTEIAKAYLGNKDT
jgi:2'-5' RNA ligase